MLPPSATRNRALITICVMPPTVMQALDTTIANAVLPYMQSSLSATLDQINWVLTSYIVAAAIMTPPTGWLAARFGRKRLFLVSVAGFIAASVLCGLATSLEQMVMFRILQGVFGAPLVPLSQSVLLDAYPREKHGSAMALWGLGVMIGPILGPTLGGYLTEVYHWRWVFYINVPIGILTLLGLSAVLEEDRGPPARPLDWFGFGTLSIAIGALQMMLDRGEHLGWFTSAEILAEAAICVLASYLFLVHTFTADRPFLEPRLFRDRNFATGLAFIFLIGVILFGTLALMAPMLQNLMGYPVLTAGYLMAPRGIGTMFAMFVVGRLFERIDPRILIASGLLLTAYSASEMSGFTTATPEALIVYSGLVQGFGLGSIFVALGAITFSTLEPELRTQATAIFSLLRNIGSSIGISLLIWLVGRSTTAMHASLVESVTAYGTTTRSLPGAWDLSTDAGRAALDAEIMRQASMIGYTNDFHLVMLLSLAALPAVMLLRIGPKTAPAKTAR